jgi:hypothetical protein
LLLNKETNTMLKHKLGKFSVFMILVVMILGSSVWAQEPYRKGTTAANFLEIGYGSMGCAMGDAVVASVNDLSSIYWNPAGLAMMRQSGLHFTMQPWIADIHTTMATAGIVLPGLGTIAVGMCQMDFGKEEVTTMDMQEGTGEHYTASDYSLSVSYARKLAQWFAFGGSVKYISSQIWHTNASAFALDLGAIVSTSFFSPTGNSSDGLSIGMSISNYGTRLKYDGLDLVLPIDPTPYTAGEYDNVEGQYRMQGWELPLIFRIGVAVNPIVTENQKFTIEADALHPNNNSESVNLGAQYAVNMYSSGTVYLRGGYKALFMADAEYGPSYGIGMIYRMPSYNNLAMKIDYGYRDIGILGAIHSYSVSFMF